MLFTFSHYARATLNKFPETRSAVPSTSQQNATTKYIDTLRGNHLRDRRLASYLLRRRFFSSMISSYTSEPASNSSSDSAAASGWLCKFSMPSLPSRKSPRYLIDCRISSC